MRSVSNLGSLVVVLALVINLEGQVLIFAFGGITVVSITGVK